MIDSEDILYHKCQQIPLEICPLIFSSFNYHPLSSSINKITHLKKCKLLNCGSVSWALEFDGWFSPAFYVLDEGSVLKIIQVKNRM